MPIVKQLLVLVLFFLLGSSPNPSFAQPNVLYKKQLKLYRPKIPINYQVRHEGDSTFLFVQYPATVRMNIKFQVFERYDKSRALQSFERIFSPNYEGGDLVLQRIYVPTPLPLTALFLEITNLDARTYVSDIIPINKRQENEQSIYLNAASDGRPILKNRLIINQEFTIQHRNLSTRYFSIKHFRRPHAPAIPPDNRTARIFNPLTNFDGFYQVKRGQVLQFSEPGVYFIQLDSSDNKGIFVFCYNNDFPEMTRVDELLNSLHYITTPKERQNMLSLDDDKKALDSYWLSRRSSRETDIQLAKSLIATYYNRIQNANLWFTSFKEGWKTDRGMVYVVMGEPDIVRKYASQEVWFYHASRERYAVELIFDRIGEQYRLKRHPQLRHPWRIEIDHWRKGNVTSLP